jgi:DNA-binding protein YbaB
MSKQRNPMMPGGGGGFTIVMTGGQQVRSLETAPEALEPADPDPRGDLLTAAFNRAVTASKDLAERKLRPFLP